MASDEDDNTLPWFLVIFAAILALVLLLSKELHNRPKLNSILSEPAMILLVGMFFSFIISFFFIIKEELGPPIEEEDDADNGDETDDQYTGDLPETLLHFPSKVIFMAFLPPILFNSGYELQRELFYRHFEPIALFAIVGTFVSGLVTGFFLYLVKILGWMGDFDPSLLELLTFGALIAATDTVSVLGVLRKKHVDPHLFSLVFGESALNDAIAILLFRSFSELLRHGIDASNALSMVGEIAFDFSMEMLGSPALGIVFAVVFAFIFKVADLRETKIVELSLYLLVMYIPFILAEVIHLSGIVTIFFSGISARRYIEPNVSDETKRNAKTIFKVTAYLAETIIFLELGLSVFGLSGSMRTKFVALAFVAALLGRAASVYPISMLWNFSLKDAPKDPLLDLNSNHHRHPANGQSIDDDDDNHSVKSHKSNASSESSSSSETWTPKRHRDKKIPVNFMHVLWFSGLRGAVAYACARHFPDVHGNRDEFIATTMVIVLITIIFMGGFTEPLLSCLNVRMGVDEKKYMKEWRRSYGLTGPLHDLEYKYIYRVVVRDASELGPGEIEMLGSSWAIDSHDGSSVYKEQPAISNYVVMEPNKTLRISVIT